jgi:hypothetical protein
MPERWKDVDAGFMSWFRNPFIIVGAVLAAIATAFQLAGVLTMPLAMVILVCGVWVFLMVEVSCSRWIRRTGSYAFAIGLFCCFLFGVLALEVGTVIAKLKMEQQRQINQDKNVLVKPEGVILSQKNTPKETRPLPRHEGPTTRSATSKCFSPLPFTQRGAQSDTGQFPYVRFVNITARDARKLRVYASNNLAGVDPIPPSAKYEIYTGGQPVRNIDIRITEDPAPESITVRLYSEYEFSVVCVDRIDPVKPPTHGSLDVVAFNSLTKMTINNLADSDAYVLDLLMDYENGSVSFSLGFMVPAHGFQTYQMPSPASAINSHSIEMLGVGLQEQLRMAADAHGSNCLEEVLFANSDPGLKQMSDFYTKYGKKIGAFPETGKLHYRVSGGGATTSELLVPMSIVVMRKDNCLKSGK